MIGSRAFPIKYASTYLIGESALCLVLHDVDHFGNVTRNGVFTDAGQLAVIAYLGKHPLEIQ